MTWWRHQWRSFHIWGQIETVLNISKFSKWPPFCARDKLFYRKWYRKLNIPERLPLAFPTFWAFGRRSSSNIDGDIAISKFDRYSPETTNLGQMQRFLEPCDLEIWRMTLKNNRAPLLCHFKLCVSFHTHWWIQIWVTVRKRSIRVKIDDFF